MRTAAARARARRRSRGQSLAEFALVFPLLMLVLGGIIQFGIIFWGLNTLNQVARDTGRWAATQQAACGSASEQAAAATAVITTANAIANQSSLIGKSSAWTSSNVTVSYSGTPCPPKNNQDEAWVRITINHTVPVFFPFVPGNGQLTAATEFRMEPLPQ